MDFFWKQLSKNPPPVITIKSSVKDEDMVKMNLIAKKSVEALEKFYDEISNESKIFTKLIYRGNLTYHKYKLFKAMQRVHCCWKKFDNLKLTATYNLFFQCIQRLDEEQFNEDNEKSLPSKQMLEYLLLRTLAMCYLAYQACWYCSDIIEKAFQQLQLGFHISLTVLIAATTSRLWILFAVLLKNCCKFYKTLHPYLFLLPSSGIDWMPKDDSLPEKIEKCSFWKDSPPPLWPKKISTDSNKQSSTDEILESLQAAENEGSSTCNKIQVKKEKKNRKKLKFQLSTDTSSNGAVENLHFEETGLAEIENITKNKKKNLQVQDVQVIGRQDILDKILAADSKKLLLKVLRNTCKKLSEEQNSILIGELKPFIKKLKGCNDNCFSAVKDDLVDHFQKHLINKKVQKKSKTKGCLEDNIMKSKIKKKLKKKERTVENVPKPFKDKILKQKRTEERRKKNGFESYPDSFSQNVNDSNEIDSIFEKMLE